MKNKLKKVVAYVLSFMMLFTMSAMNIGSVSAASTGSITLNVAQHDIGATTFSVYKLMDATSANDKIAYTVNSDFKEFFKQTDVANSEDDEVVYNYIKNHVKNDDFTTKLKNVDDKEVHLPKFQALVLSPTNLEQPLNVSDIVKLEDDEKTSPELVIVVRFGQSLNVPLKDVTFEISHPEMFIVVDLHP